MSAFTEGLQSGILSANILLADTGPVPSDGGYPFPLFWMSSSVSATIEVQHRNAANSATIWSHRFYVNALQPFSSPAITTNTFLMAEGERIRLVLVTSLIGAVQGTIIFT